MESFSGRNVWIRSSRARRVRRSDSQSIFDEVLAFSQGSLRDDAAVLTVMLTGKGSDDWAAARPFRQERLV